MSELDETQVDCTGWDGPYDTSKEALDAVKETYECDDNGDTEEEAIADARSNES
jgi:hypothetical protein